MRPMLGIVSILAILGAVVAQHRLVPFAADPKILVPPGNTPRFEPVTWDSLLVAQETVRPEPLWRLVAGWECQPPSAKLPKARVPERLVAVAIEFQGSPKGPGPTVRIDSRVGDEVRRKAAREALGFFWQPACTVTRAGKDKEERFVVEPKPARPTAPRFELVVEPAIPDAKVIRDEPYYQVTGSRQIVPTDIEGKGTGTVLAHKGMESVARLMREIGRSGRGRVSWLSEPGQPPERFLLVWLAEGKPWLKPRVASPMFETEPVLEVGEPTAEGDETDGGRTGFALLREGTWERIEAERRTGATLICLGREGLAFETKRRGVYRVHHHRGPGWAEPIETRGIVDGLPPWAKLLRPPLDQRPEAAKHLVALSACSPAVWKKTRSAEPKPPFHLTALFADPELWACGPDVPFKDPKDNR